MIWFRFDRTTGIIAQPSITADANPWPKASDTHDVAAFDATDPEAQAAAIHPAAYRLVYQTSGDSAGATLIFTPRTVS